MIDLPARRPSGPTARRAGERSASGSVYDATHPRGEHWSLYTQSLRRDVYRFDRRPDSVLGLSSGVNSMGPTVGFRPGRRETHRSIAGFVADSSIPATTRLTSTSNAGGASRPRSSTTVPSRTLSAATRTRSSGMTSLCWPGRWLLKESRRATRDHLHAHGSARRPWPCSPALGSVRSIRWCLEASPPRS